MKNFLKLALSVCVGVGLFILTLVVIVPPARAQDPTGRWVYPVEVIETGENINLSDCSPSQTDIDPDNVLDSDEDYGGGTLHSPDCNGSLWQYLKVDFGQIFTTSSALNDGGYNMTGSTGILSGGGMMLAGEPTIEVSEEIDGPWTEVLFWPSYPEYSYPNTIISSLKDISFRYARFTKGSGFAGGGDLTFTWKYFAAYVDESQIPEAEALCSTVPAYHFTDALSDTWTLGGYATISDSELILVPSYSYATQQITTTSSVYTVTMRAKTTTDAPYYVNIYLSENPPPEHTIFPSSVSVIDIISSTFDIYTTTIQNTNGVSSYLTIEYDGLGGAPSDVSVDWICISGADDIPICQASFNVFDLNIGTNYGTIFDDVYGVSGGWTGVNYFDGSDTDAPEMQTLLAFDYTEGLFSSRLLGWSTGEQTAVSYQYQMIPEVFTVTGIYPTGTDPTLEVWQQGDDNQWVETIFSISKKQFATISTTGYLDYGSVTYDTGDFLEVITQPVYIGLAMVTNDDGSAESMGFDQIDIFGCATGDPANAGECIFADFDLNMNNGEPSPFWWQGDYFPQTDGATIGNDQVIYQNVLPPQPGLYNLQIVADSSGGMCSFDVKVYRVNTTQLLSNQSVPCQAGIAQNYTIPLDLPGDAVQIGLYGVQGEVFVDLLCLENPYNDLQCLNQNPLFSLGSQYYNGDFSTGGGLSTLADNGRIGSVSVDYNAAPPPYQLTLSLSSPDADTWVTLGNYPGAYSTDQSYNISGNSTISYTFDEALAGGYGPILFNQGPDTVEVSQYCIQHTDTYTPTTPYDCDTVTNPHFEDSTGWNYNNVIIYSSVASFGPGGVVSQTLGGTSEASATVRLLVSAYQTADAIVKINAISGSTTTEFQETVTVAASNDKAWLQVSFPFTTTYDSVDLEIDGETGLEVDFVCVIYAGSIPVVPGEDLPPGTIDPVLAECLPPPMGIFPPITSATWAQSIWPWSSPGPDNFETVMIYNTAWVRYIGCRFDSFYKWMIDQWATLIRLLNVIIFLLGLQPLLTALNNILNAILGLTDVIDDAVSDILSALLGILPLIGVLLLLVGAIWVFLYIVIRWLWFNIFTMANIPIDFINAFQAAINDTSYGDLVTCTDGNFWCGFIAGIQLVNQTIGDTIAYPIVILLIIVVTIMVIWKNLRELFSLDIR